MLLIGVRVYVLLEFTYQFADSLTMTNFVLLSTSARARAFACTTLNCHHFQQPFGFIKYAICLRLFSFDLDVVLERPFTPILYSKHCIIYGDEIIYQGITRDIYS